MTDPEPTLPRLETLIVERPRIDLVQKAEAFLGEQFGVFSIIRVFYPETGRFTLMAAVLDKVAEEVVEDLRNLGLSQARIMPTSAAEVTVEGGRT